MLDENLCNAIRPFDRVTLCNRLLNHEYEHMNKDHEGYALATWDAEGNETCDHCGYAIVDGMCGAPLSVAD